MHEAYVSIFNKGLGGKIVIRTEEILGLTACWRWLGAGSWICLKSSWLSLVFGLI